MTGRPGSARWRFFLHLRVFLAIRGVRLRHRLGQLRPLSMFRHVPRPLALVLVGALVPLSIAWLLSLFFPAEARGIAAAFRTLFTSTGRAPSTIEWREALQVLLLVIGLPAAFILWLFRDINVNATLANQRKDVNLKEFQEIQLRASGALDEKLPAEARQQLQIAALHQIRAFLRGEYGDSFRRPAFELLLAGHMAALERIGHEKAIDAWLGTRVSRDEDTQDMRVALDEARSRLTPVDRERLRIIGDEADAVFGKNFPLRGRRYDWVALAFQRFPGPRIFHDCTFFGANLAGARLEGADLTRARLEGALLSGARLEGACLFSAELTRASLRFARLDGANLAYANLEGAALYGARLTGANLGQAQLVRARLQSAWLEGASLNRAVLENANMAEANLEGANLSDAWLVGADLSDARLEGAILSRARFEGADLTGVNPTLLADCRDMHFNAATKFAPLWERLPEEVRDLCRKPWLDRGAVRCDLPLPPSPDVSRDKLIALRKKARGL